MISEHVERETISAMDDLGELGHATIVIPRHNVTFRGDKPREFRVILELYPACGQRLILDGVRGLLVRIISEWRTRANIEPKLKYGFRLSEHERGEIAYRFEAQLLTKEQQS